MHIFPMLGICWIPHSSTYLHLIAFSDICVHNNCRFINVLKYDDGDMILLHIVSVESLKDEYVYIITVGHNMA